MCYRAVRCPSRLSEVGLAWLGFLDLEGPCPGQAGSALCLGLCSSTGAELRGRHTTSWFRVCGEGDARRLQRDEGTLTP